MAAQVAIEGTVVAGVVAAFAVMVVVSMEG